MFYGVFKIGGVKMFNFIKYSVYDRTWIDFRPRRQQKIHDMVNDYGFLFSAFRDNRFEFGYGQHRVKLTRHEADFLYKLLDVNKRRIVSLSNEIRRQLKEEQK